MLASMAWLCMACAIGFLHSSVVVLPVGGTTLLWVVKVCVSGVDPVGWALRGPYWDASVHGFVYYAGHLPGGWYGFLRNVTAPVQFSSVQKTSGKHWHRIALCML